MVQRREVRYSVCFKQQVIEDLENGRFASLLAAREHYGIKGAWTINRWLRRYGRNHLLPKVVRVEKPDEADQIARLKKQIAELQRALGQTQAENVLSQEYLKLACERLGEEVESFKKKSGGRPCTAPRPREVSVRALCQLAGMTRQNFYKQRQVRQKQALEEQLILELVLQERCRQPRLGARKLLWLIDAELRRAGVSVGRDRFLALLRERELLIERQARVARTTDSRHGYGSYANLAKDAVVTAPHQLLLSDITYLRTMEGFVFLCLVSDAFSRSIVGFDCSDSLERDGALRSLRMALGQLPEDAEAMHHSDRGCQYCCGEYVRALLDRGVRISMTEANHCYENAQAERLNGILKQEYGLGQTFRSKADALVAVKEAVMLYNHHRPHEALSYRIPMSVHLSEAA